MKQPAKGAIIRLASKHSEIIRKSIRASIDVNAVMKAWEESHPIEITNQQARDWAKTHIHPDGKPIVNALKPLYADAYVLGQTAAKYIIAHKTRNVNKAIKADPSASVVDWATWTPGNASASALVSPAGALENMLQSRQITVQGINSTTLDRIGTQLGIGISRGDTPTQIAQSIQDVINDPQRALTIAQTEMSRAVVQSELSQYRDSGVEMLEWLVADPCDECAANEDASPISIDDSWPNGDAPVHPNCMCDIAPFIDENAVIADTTDSGGVDIGDVVDAASIIEDAVAEVIAPVETPLEAIARLESQPFIEGAWTELTQEQVSAEFYNKLMNYKGVLLYTKDLNDVERKAWIDARLRKEDKLFLQKNAVYQNGSVKIKFSSTGYKIPDAQKKELFKRIEKLQKANPKEKLEITVSQNMRNAYAKAEINGSRMWISPRTILDPTLNVEKESTGWKMPSLADAGRPNYTLAHEWGHLLDSTRFDINSVMKLKKEFPDAFVSDYAKTKPVEFFAEMFADYFTTGGTTDNPLVQKMAQTYGWKV